MQRLRDISKVWWWIDREFDQTLGRYPRQDESITIVIVVSALTKMLKAGRTKRCEHCGC